MNDTIFLKAHDDQMNLLFSALKYSNNSNTPEKEWNVELDYINQIQKQLFALDGQELKPVWEYLNWIDCQISKYIREIKNDQVNCHIGLKIASYVSYLN